MKYIIFDLEYNQGFDFEKNVSKQYKFCPFEIIQLGAVKLGDELDIVGTFNSYVKPKLYKALHPYVPKITKIKYSDFKKAPKFNEVYWRFNKFFTKDRETVICSWGRDDIVQFKRNMNLYRIEAKYRIKFLDIQKVASRFFKTPNGNAVGLEKATNYLKIDKNLAYHNAFYDAVYTAEVFKYICKYLDDFRNGIDVTSDLFEIPDRKNFVPELNIRISDYVQIVEL